ncbi:MAG: AMP-binding protein [Bacteroidia bacterium]
MLEKIIESFDRHAAENAFCISNNFFTYSDLNKNCGSIQGLINKLQLPDNSNIGIVTYDDIQTYSSVFSIVFSGHAFVPINPANPSERNKAIIEQAGIKYILSSSSSESLMEIINSGITLINTTEKITDSIFKPEALDKNKLAYLLFTSGSTGVPKGVPITVGNLDAFLDAFFSLGYKINNTDRFLQMFDMTFDLSLMSYMAPLCIGACVYTVPFDAIKYTYIYSLFEDHKITFALMVPSILTHLRPYFDEIKLDAMRYSLFCGEALYEDIILEWSECIPNALIENVYGPTEATIFCMTIDVKREGGNKSFNGIIAIGKPMENTNSINVNENNIPLGAGDKGELCLSGKQITPGYWKNELKNSEAFFILKENGETVRYYRTGDLCYFDNDGDFFYCGRVDHQVKIQGFRVELNEIEHYAREFLQQHNVVAVPFTNSIGNTLIHLFIENYSGSFHPLTDYLKTKIPSYMIPNKFTSIATFPMNANYKIDRKALAETLKIKN